MKGARSKVDSKKTDIKLKSKGAAPGKRSMKAAKDLIMPQWAPCAFFVFMDDFMKQYKEENPNNHSLSDIEEAGGEKWKKLSDAEKAPYVDKAEKGKIEYNKQILAYNLSLELKMRVRMDEDGSDESESEVSDEEDEGTDSEEDEDDGFFPGMKMMDRSWQKAFLFSAWRA